MRNIVLFSGSAHPRLSEAIAACLGIPLGRVKLSKFSNKETNVEIGESVRDLDTYIISTGCGKVNDNLIELLILINACKGASARKVTVVIPCFPYARQPDTPYKKNGAPLSRFSEPEKAKYKHLVRTASATASPEKPLRSQNPVVELGSPFKTSLSSLAISPSRVETATSTNPFFIDASDAPKTVLVSDEFKQDGLIEATSTATKSQLDPAFRRRTSSTVSLDQSARISTISTSQPQIEVKALQPQTPSMKPIPVASTGGSTGGYKHWTARSGTLIANMLVAAGADHIITMDLHDPQFQGMFDIPVDNLLSKPLLAKYIREKIHGYKDAVIVSPDAGGAKRATLIADSLKMDFALIHKERRQGVNGNSPTTCPLEQQIREDAMKLVGDVQGKLCILIDDIADTSITITKAAKLLHDQGAKRIVALITHAILSGESIQRINASFIDEVIVSNTVPQEEHRAKCSKIKVMDVAPFFAEAIRRIHNGESVSFLFNSLPY